MQLEINQISVKYGQNTAVDGVSLQLQRGEIGCLLGPSGCGKTSVLRAIAGFEPITNGTITLDQRLLANQTMQLSPQQRGIGMVFQDFALYPHLTVGQNVAFGIAHLTKSEQRQRINELLTLVDLKQYEKTYPHALSGGQQQRVALIRAMAPKPELLLLDEPFSNLDVTLRQSLANELRQLLKTTGMTAILVSHDQNEAYAMADGIGVMEHAKLVQWGSADDLYQTPANKFVASFVGQSAFIKATRQQGRLHTAIGSVDCLEADLAKTDAGLQVQIRPEHVVIDASSAIKATVVKSLHMGAHKLYTLSLDNQEQVLSLAPNHLQHYIGQTVGLKLTASRLNCFGQS